MEKWPRRVAGVEGWGGGAPRCLDHLVEGGGGRAGPRGPATAGAPAGKEGSQRECANALFPPSSLNVWTGGDLLGGRGSARVTAVSYFQVGRGRSL